VVPKHAPKVSWKSFQGIWEKANGLKRINTQHMVVVEPKTKKKYKTKKEKKKKIVVQELITVR
jgi:hypothetical protein